MAIPDPIVLLNNDSQHEYFSKVLTLEVFAHEWARYLKESGSEAYKLFLPEQAGVSPIPGSKMAPQHQWAAAFGWLMVDQVEERDGISQDTQNLKNAELWHLGLPPGTDLSFLYDTPAIQMIDVFQN